MNTSFSAILSAQILHTGKVNKNPVYELGSIAACVCVDIIISYCYDYY